MLWSGSALNCGLKLLQNSAETTEPICWLSDVFEWTINRCLTIISGIFGLNRSSIEQGIRYSCYPLVVVFNILSWYRFHCRGMTKHLWIYPLKMVIFHSKLLVYRRVMMVSSGDEWNHLLVIKRGWLENQRNGGNAWSLLTTHQQSSSGQGWYCQQQYSPILNIIISNSYIISRIWINIM